MIDGPFASFSTKASKGGFNKGGFGAKQFGRNIQKVDGPDIRSLVNSNQIKLITPDDAFGIISRHGKGKIRKQAADIRSIMQKNNEVLMQGIIPSDLVRGLR